MARPSSLASITHHINRPLLSRSCSPPFPRLNLLQAACASTTATSSSSSSHSTSSQSQAPQDTPPHAAVPASKSAPAPTDSISAHGMARSLAETFMSNAQPRTYTRISRVNAHKKLALNSITSSLREAQGSIERMAPRRWEAGEVIAPHDLSAVEMQKWRMRQRPRRDVLDVLGLDPRNEWKNPVLLAEFVTSMGRIRGRRETGLRAVNQRRLAKAVRRAVGMGFLPSVHYHPEMLRRPGGWRFT